MGRITLEGVCSDVELHGRLLELAQESRALGDDAAHFMGRPVSGQDVRANEIV